MGLKIRSHSGEPRFESIHDFGKPIFDLTLAAKIGHSTRVFRCIEDIQNKAKDAGLAVQVLPQLQTHLTILNPIFRMEGKGVIPQKNEQDELFNKFVKALGSISRNKRLLPPVKLDFEEIHVRQRDVKLLASISPDLTSAQTELQCILTKTDSRFDFAEGLPHIDGRVFSTILRFKEGFSQENHDKLMKILEAHSLLIGLEMEIIPVNIMAVQFNGLFEPWVKEAEI